MASTTPTGSWPTISPSRTGYSPFRMWTSVPQIVVSVTFTSASPTPGSGRGTSRIAIFPFPANTAARIVIIYRSPASRWCTGGARSPSGRVGFVHEPHRLGHLLQPLHLGGIGRGEGDGHALVDVLDLDARVGAHHRHRAHGH